MNPCNRDPDFDWITDDSVILEPRRALAVYVNQRGEVVLRQQMDWNEDQDSFVCFPMNDAEHVALQILQMVKGPVAPWHRPRSCTLTESKDTSGSPRSGEAEDPDLFPEDGANGR